MNIRSLFGRRGSATVARDRLQILLAHEKLGGGTSDLILALREDVLAAIAKHVAIDQTKLNVNMKKEDSVSIIEIDLEIPHPEVQRGRASAMA